MLRRSTLPMKHWIRCASEGCSIYGVRLEKVENCLREEKIELVTSLCIPDGKGIKCYDAEFSGNDPVEESNQMELRGKTVVVKSICRLKPPVVILERILQNNKISTRLLIAVDGSIYGSKKECRLRANRIRKPHITLKEEIELPKVDTPPIITLKVPSIPTFKTVAAVAGEWVTEVLIEWGNRNPHRNFPKFVAQTADSLRNDLRKLQARSYLDRRSLEEEFSRLQLPVPEISDDLVRPFLQSACRLLGELIQ